MTPEQALKEFDEKLRNILLATMESYHDKRKAFESGVASQGLCTLAIDEAQKMITYSVKSSLEKVAREAVSNCKFSKEFANKSESMSAFNDGVDAVINSMGLKEES